MKILSKCHEETCEAGRRLGKRLKQGDVVCLYGDLGAGKTTMVKGIASTQGIDERDVTSASFTIISEYKAQVPFYHIDLYRIAPGEAFDIGLHECLASGGIAVIEWAEKGGSEIPDSAISVHIRYMGETMREIEIAGIAL